VYNGISLHVKLWICVRLYTYCLFLYPHVLSPFRGGGLRTSMTRIAMMAGVVYSWLGLPSQTGRRIEVRQSCSSLIFFNLYFPIFLPFTFLLLYSFVSPFSVLFSSIYNLFALLGRKTPFLHSLFYITNVEMYVHVSVCVLICIIYSWVILFIT